ncbi:V-set and transmembrane domain-containing protein 1-like [Antechinus flavipes]|uniref:V-set and transmembrane domain-containing protein 1-like n=1 Tax=Antechinus flavipes TaxID=38775 RepID=UPI00223563FE|nr:V-set and transmembrane domain-containing protein 1-like [Antechinus flavipes]
MASTLSFLLCLGLCLSQRIRAQEGLLPKPNLSVQKSFILVPRGNVTFRCNMSDDDLPPLKWTYQLFKEGNSKPLCSKTTEASWVKFTLPFTTTQDFGNYSCKFFDSQNPQNESESSMVLEISEKGAMDKPLTIVSKTTLIILCCIIILFFLFLLAFVYHQFYLGTPKGKATRRYRHDEKENNPSNSGTEEYGVTYSQLNMKSLNKGRSAPPLTTTSQEATTYSTVAWHKRKMDTYKYTFGK